LRYHRRALAVVLLIVGAGAVLFHRKAFTYSGSGRLAGVIWPVPATQVAHFAALFAGITIVLWFVHLVRPRTALIGTGLSVIAMILTHTRTAVVAMLVGLLVAAVSLYLTRQRVRRAFAVTAVAGGLIALSFAPFLSGWFFRGQTSSEFDGLTGRSNVWAEVTAQPRTELNTIFGFGMSNDSFNGLSIDSAWYAAYLNQGLLGDVADGAALLALFLIALMTPRGPRQALALFIVTYTLIQSFTQTGLGEASPCMLDLMVTASLLMAPIGTGDPSDQSSADIATGAPSPFSSP
ncbi:MAG: O-antigen ligase family protein, partial [Nitrososphaerales archaeon]